MTRPLRLEFAGALYHITSRGDRREDIYLNDDDRRDWLDILGNACQRFNWVVHAFCQMSNHHHLLLETVDGNLARGMRQLNGEYTWVQPPARAGGASVPRAVQGDPGAEGKLFAGADALRRAEPLAREDGDFAR